MTWRCTDEDTGASRAAESELAHDAKLVGTASVTTRILNLLDCVLRSDVGVLLTARAETPGIVEILAPGVRGARTVQIQNSRAGRAALAAYAAGEAIHVSDGRRTVVASVGRSSLGAHVRDVLAAWDAALPLADDVAIALPQAFLAAPPCVDACDASPAETPPPVTDAVVPPAPALLAAPPSLDARTVPPGAPLEVTVRYSALLEKSYLDLTVQEVGSKWMHTYHLTRVHSESLAALEAHTRGAPVRLTFIADGARHFRDVGRIVSRDGTPIEDLIARMRGSSTNAKGGNS